MRRQSVVRMMNSKMNSKMKISDKANILASRDKHSVVRSFQDTFKEDLKFSKQRASRHRPSAEQGKPKHEFRVGAMTVPYDADKLAKDAGGNIKEFHPSRNSKYLQSNGPSVSLCDLCPQ